MDRQKEAEWNEAKRRCRLTDEEVRMAKDLGFQPRSLIKNIPSRSQQWKAPVNEWVRSLHQEKLGSRKSPEETASVAQQGEERRNAEAPWPDRPEIADLPPLDLDAEFPDDEFGFDRYEPPDEDDIEEQNGLILRRQRLLRWAAEAIAVKWSRLPEVEKVAAFGAASQPLEMEVPRFPQFRRHRIEVLHECADLDLAVWLTDLGRLRDLKNAMARGL
jgi:hypothetical protein